MKATRGTKKEMAATTGLTAKQTTATAVAGNADARHLRDKLQALLKRFQKRHEQLKECEAALMSQLREAIVITGADGLPASTAQSTSSAWSWWRGSKTDNTSVCSSDPLTMWDMVSYFSSSAKGVTDYVTSKIQRPWTAPSPISEQLNLMGENPLFETSAAVSGGYPTFMKKALVGEDPANDPDENLEEEERELRTKMTEMMMRSRKENTEEHSDSESELTTKDLDILCEIQELGRYSSARRERVSEMQRRLFWMHELTPPNISTAPTVTSAIVAPVLTPPVMPTVCLMHGVEEADIKRVMHDLRQVLTTLEDPAGESDECFAKALAPSSHRSAKRLHGSGGTPTLFEESRHSGIDVLASSEPVPVPVPAPPAPPGFDTEGTAMDLVAQDDAVDSDDADIEPIVLSTLKTTQNELEKLQNHLHNVCGHYEEARAEAQTLKRELQRVKSSIQSLRERSRSRGALKQEVDARRLRSGLPQASEENRTETSTAYLEADIIKTLQQASDTINRLEVFPPDSGNTRSGSRKSYASPEQREETNPRTFKRSRIRSPRLSPRKRYGRKENYLDKRRSAKRGTSAAESLLSNAIESPQPVVPSPTAVLAAQLATFMDDPAVPRELLEQTLATALRDVPAGCPAWVAKKHIMKALTLLAKEAASEEEEVAAARLLARVTLADASAQPLPSHRTLATSGFALTKELADADEDAPETAAATAVLQLFMGVPFREDLRARAFVEILSNLAAAWPVSEAEAGAGARSVAVATLHAMAAAEGDAAAAAELRRVAAVLEQRPDSAAGAGSSARAIQSAPPELVRRAARSLAQLVRKNRSYGEPFKLSSARMPDTSATGDDKGVNLEAARMSYLLRGIPMRAEVAHAVYAEALSQAPLAACGAADAKEQLMEAVARLAVGQKDLAVSSELTTVLVNVSLQDPSDVERAMAETDERALKGAASEALAAAAAMAAAVANAAPPVDASDERPKSAVSGGGPDEVDSDYWPGGFLAIAGSDAPLVPFFRKRTASGRDVICFTQEKESEKWAEVQSESESDSDVDSFISAAEEGEKEEIPTDELESQTGQGDVTRHSTESYPILRGFPLFPTAEQDEESPDTENPIGIGGSEYVTSEEQLKGMDAIGRLHHQGDWYEEFANVLQPLPWDREVWTVTGSSAAFQGKPVDDEGGEVNQSTAGQSQHSQQTQQGGNAPDRGELGGGQPGGGFDAAGGGQRANPGGEPGSGKNWCQDPKCPKRRPRPTCTCPATGVTPREAPGGEPVRFAVGPSAVTVSPSAKSAPAGGKQPMECDICSELQVSTEMIAMRAAPPAPSAFTVSPSTKSAPEEKKPAGKQPMECDICSELEVSATKLGPIDSAFAPTQRSAPGGVCSPETCNAPPGGVCNIPGCVDPATQAQAPSMASMEVGRAAPSPNDVCTKELCPFPNMSTGVCNMPGCTLSTAPINITVTTSEVAPMPAGASEANVCQPSECPTSQTTPLRVCEMPGCVVAGAAAPRAIPSPRPSPVASRDICRPEKCPVPSATPENVCTHPECPATGDARAMPEQAPPSADDVRCPASTSDVSCDPGRCPAVQAALGIASSEPSQAPSIHSQAMQQRDMPPPSSDAPSKQDICPASDLNKECFPNTCPVLKELGGGPSAVPTIQEATSERATTPLGVQCPPYPPTAVECPATLPAATDVCTPDRCPVMRSVPPSVAASAVPSAQIPPGTPTSAVCPPRGGPVDCPATGAEFAGVCAPATCPVMGAAAPRQMPEAPVPFRDGVSEKELQTQSYGAMPPVPTVCAATCRTLKPDPKAECTDNSCPLQTGGGGRGGPPPALSPARSAASAQQRAAATPMRSAASAQPAAVASARACGATCPCFEGCPHEWLQIVQPLSQRHEDAGAILRVLREKQTIADDLLAKGQDTLTQKDALVDTLQTTREPPPLPEQINEQNYLGYAGAKLLSPNNPCMAPCMGAGESPMGSQMSAAVRQGGASPAASGRAGPPGPTDSSCVTRCAKCRGRLPAGADEGGAGAGAGAVAIRPPWGAAEHRPCPCAQGCADEWLRLVGPLRRRAEDVAATLRAAAAKRALAHDLPSPLRARRHPCVGGKRLAEEHWPCLAASDAYDLLTPYKELKDVQQYIGPYADTDVTKYQSEVLSPSSSLKMVEDAASINARTIRCRVRMSAGADRADDAGNAADRPCPQPCGSHICFPHIVDQPAHVCTCACLDEVNVASAPAGIPTIVAENDEGPISLEPGGPEVLSIHSYTLRPIVTGNSPSHESFLRRLELITPPEGEAEAAADAGAGVGVGAGAGAGEGPGAGAGEVQEEAGAVGAPPGFDASGPAGRSAASPAHSKEGALAKIPSDVVPERSHDPDCGCPPENEGLSGPLGPCCNVMENKCYRWPHEKMQEIAAEFAHLHPLFIPCACCEGREELMERRKPAPRPPPSAPPHRTCRLCRVQRAEATPCPCKRSRLNMWNERTEAMIARRELGGASGDRSATRVTPGADLQLPEQLPPEPAADASLPPGLPPPAHPDSADRFPPQLTASDEDRTALWLQQAKVYSERMEKVLDELTEKVELRDLAAAFREPDVLLPETLAPEPGKPQGIGTACRDYAAVEGKLAPTSCLNPIECNPLCLLAGKPPPLKLTDFEFVVFDKTPPIPEDDEEESQVVHRMGSLYIAGGNVLGSLLKIPSGEILEESSEKEVTSWKETESVGTSKVSQATAASQLPYADIPKGVSTGMMSPAVSGTNVGHSGTAITGLSVSEILPLPADNANTAALVEKAKREADLHTEVHLNQLIKEGTPGGFDKDNSCILTCKAECEQEGKVCEGGEIDMDLNISIQKEQTPVDSSPVSDFYQKQEVHKTPVPDREQSPKYSKPMYSTPLDLKVKPYNSEFSWREPYKSRAMELIENDLPSVSKDIYHIRTQDMHMAEVEYTEDDYGSKIVRRGEWDEEEKMMPESENSSSTTSSPLAIERIHARIHEVEQNDANCSKVETEMSWHQRFVMLPPPGYSDNAARLADDDDKLYLLFRKMDARLQQQEQLKDSVLDSVCVTSWSEVERCLPSKTEKDYSKQQTSPPDSIIERMLEGAKTESINAHANDVRNIKQSSWKETEKEIRQGEENKIISTRTGKSEEVSGPNTFKRQDTVSDVSKEAEYQESAMGAMDALLSKMQTTFDNLRSAMHSHGRPGATGQQNLEPSLRTPLGKPSDLSPEVKIPWPSSSHPSRADQIPADVHLMETINEGEKKGYIASPPACNALATKTHKDHVVYSPSETSSECSTKISNESKVQTEFLKTVFESTKANIISSNGGTTVFTLRPVNTAISVFHEVSKGPLEPSISSDFAHLVNDTSERLQTGLSKEESALIQSLLAEGKTNMVKSEHEIKVNTSLITPTVTESESIRGALQSTVGIVRSYLPRGDEVGQKLQLATHLGSTQTISSPIASAEKQFPHYFKAQSPKIKLIDSHAANQWTIHQHSSDYISKANSQSASRVERLLRSISSKDLNKPAQLNVSEEECEVIKQYIENDVQEVESAVPHEDVKHSVVHLQSQFAALKPNVTLDATALGLEGMNWNINEKCTVVSDFNVGSVRKISCPLVEEDFFVVDPQSVISPREANPNPAVDFMIPSLPVTTKETDFKDLTEDTFQITNVFREHYSHTSSENDVAESIPFAASRSESDTIGIILKNDGQDGDATPPTNDPPCQSKHIAHELSPVYTAEAEKAKLISCEFSQVVAPEPREVLWSDLDTVVESPEQSEQQKQIAYSITEYQEYESVNGPIPLTPETEFVAIHVCEALPEEYQVKENIVNPENVYDETTSVLSIINTDVNSVLDAADDHQTNLCVPLHGDFRPTLNMGISSELGINTVFNEISILSQTSDTKENVENRKTAIQDKDPVEFISPYKENSRFETNESSEDSPRMLISQDSKIPEAVQNRFDTSEKSTEMHFSNITVSEKLLEASDFPSDEYCKHISLPIISQFASLEVPASFADNYDDLNISVEEKYNNSDIFENTSNSQFKLEIDITSSDNIEEKIESHIVIPQWNKETSALEMSSLKVEEVCGSVIKIPDTKLEKDNVHKIDVSKPGNIICEEMKSKTEEPENQPVLHSVSEISPYLPIVARKSEVSLVGGILEEKYDEVEPEVEQNVLDGMMNLQNEPVISVVPVTESSHLTHEQHLQGKPETSGVCIRPTSNHSSKVISNEDEIIDSTDNEYVTNETVKSDNNALRPVTSTVSRGSSSMRDEDKIEVKSSMLTEDFRTCIQNSGLESEMEKLEDLKDEHENIKGVREDSIIHVSEILNLESHSKSSIDMTVTSKADSTLFDNTTNYTSKLPINNVSAYEHSESVGLLPEPTDELQFNKSSSEYSRADNLMERKRLKPKDTPASLDDSCEMCPLYFSTDSEETEVEYDVPEVKKEEESIIESDIKTGKIMKSATNATYPSVPKEVNYEAGTSKATEDIEHPIKQSVPELQDSELTRSNRKPCIPTCPRRRGRTRQQYRKYHPRPKGVLPIDRGHKQVASNKHRVKPDVTDRGVKHLAVERSGNFEEELPLLSARAESWASGDSVAESEAAPRRDHKAEWVYRSVSDLIERIANEAPKAFRPLEWARRLKLITRNTRYVQSTLRDLARDTEVIQMFRSNEHLIMSPNTPGHVERDSLDDFEQHLEKVFGARKRLAIQDANECGSNSSSLIVSPSGFVDGDEYAEYLLKKYRKSRPSQLPGHYASQISPDISTMQAPTFVRSQRSLPRLTEEDENKESGEHTQPSHISHFHPDVVSENALSYCTVETNSVFFNEFPEYLSAYELQTNGVSEPPNVSNGNLNVDDAPLSVTDGPDSNLIPLMSRSEDAAEDCRVPPPSDLPFTNIFCLCGEYDVLHSACACASCQRGTRNKKLPPEDAECTCPRSKDGGPECEDETCGMNSSDTECLSVSDVSGSFVTATDQRDASPGRSQPLTDEEKTEDREESEPKTESAATSAGSGDSIAVASTDPDESISSRIDEDRSLRGKRVEEVREIPMPDRLFTAAWPMGRPQSAPAMAATAGDWVMEAAASDAGSASGAGSQGLKSPTVLSHGLALRQSNSKIFKDAERVIRRTQRGQCCSREQCCCELDIITAQLRIELQSLRERLMRNTREMESGGEAAGAGAAPEVELDAAPADCCALLNSLLTALGSLRSTGADSSTWAAEDLPPPPPPPDLLRICAHASELTNISPSGNELKSLREQDITRIQESVESSGPSEQEEQIVNTSDLPSDLTRMSSREMLIFTQNIFENTNITDEQKKEYLERISPWLELVANDHENIVAGEILWHARRLSTVLEESASITAFDKFQERIKAARASMANEGRPPQEARPQGNQEEDEPSSSAGVNQLPSPEDTNLSQERSQARKDNPENIERDDRKEETSSYVGERQLPQEYAEVSGTKPSHFKQSAGALQQSNVTRIKCAGMSCKREKLMLKNDHTFHVKSLNMPSPTSKTPFNKKQTGAEGANNDVSTQKVNTLYSPSSASDTPSAAIVYIGDQTDNEAAGSSFKDDCHTAARDDINYKRTSTKDKAGELSYNAPYFHGNRCVKVSNQRSIRKERRSSPREDLIFSYKTSTTEEDRMPESSYNTFLNTNQPNAEVAGHSPPRSQRNLLSAQNRVCKKISRPNASQKPSSGSERKERKHQHASSDSSTPPTTEERFLKRSWLPHACYHVFSVLWRKSAISKLLSQTFQRTKAKPPPWQTASAGATRPPAARRSEAGGLASAVAPAPADAFPSPAEEVEAEAAPHPSDAGSDDTAVGKRHRRRRAAPALRRSAHDHSECRRDEGDAAALEAAASAEMPAQAELRIVDSQSLLLRWPLVEGAIGYEIFVNGKLRQKVYSGTRDQAALLDMDLKQLQYVAVYPRLLVENDTPMPSANATYVPSNNY